MSEEEARKPNRSHDHVHEHLDRERRNAEALRGEWGREVVDKLDRRVLRDVLYYRKQRSLDRIFASDSSEPAEVDGAGVRIPVVVNLRQARRDRSVFPPARGLREQMRVVRELEASGRLALSRIEEHADQEDVEIERSLWLTGSAVMTVTVEQLRRVAARNDVVSVANNKPMLVLCLDVSRPLIRADQVETLGIDGTGVTVAVIDTGVDAAHPALTGVVASQQDLTGEGTGDMHGHGTHCAGIVASQDRTRRGIAPGARVADIKVLDQTGGGTPGNIVAGFQAAVTAGVQVVSASLGASHKDGLWQDPPSAGQPDDSCVLCVAANNAVAAGVVCCVAAGNDGNDSCSSYDTHVNCPGNARSAITVGASDDSDNMAGFSSVGPTPQGRQKPDLVAPGNEIGSCRASGTNPLGASPIDDFWTNMSGTSQATPHVAGLAALMLNRTPALSPANVLAAMTTTAVNIGASAEEMGAGRIDALDAVNAV